MISYQSESGPEQWRRKTIIGLPSFSMPLMSPPAAYRSTASAPARSGILSIAFVSLTGLIGRNSTGKSARVLHLLDLGADRAAFTLGVGLSLDSAPVRQLVWGARVGTE